MASDGALYPVNDGDLFGIGDVDEDAAAAFLQLEGFRVGGQFDAADEFGGGGVNDGEGAFAVAEPGEFGLRVEAQVVGVGQGGEVLEHFVVGAAEDLQGAVVAVGHDDLVLVREIEDAGGLGHSGDAPDALAGGEVNDFQGVVAEGGDKEPLAFRVDGEVVEAAFDARERDGLGELERGWLRGVDRESQRAEQQQGGAFHGGYLLP